MSETDQTRSGTEPADSPSGESSETWEQLRRSVAMLSPGAWALRREQALAVLNALVRARRP